MKFIFIDTNIFLHFKSILAVDWSRFHKKVTLVIAPIVIDELDRKKQDNSRVSKNARKALQILEQPEKVDFKAKKGTSIQLLVLDKKPAMNVFSENELIFEEPDQKLLASIIEFRSSTENSDVLLCSDDVGIRLRAKRRAIEVVQLQDSDRLSEEDERDKELKTLKVQLQAIKSRQPSLKLTFLHGNDYGYVERDQINIPDRNSRIQEEMLLIRSKHPRMRAKVGDPFNAIMGPSAGQIKNHNSQLDIFYRKYESWMSQIIDFEIMKLRTFEVTVVLANEGTLKASDIDIHLQIPKSVGVLLNIKPPTGKKPKPPVQPTSAFDKIIGNSIQGINIKKLLSESDKTEESNDLRETEEHYELDLHVDELKHDYTLKLDPFFIIYEDFESFHNITIDYTITSENTVDNFSGQLHLIAEQ